VTFVRRRIELTLQLGTGAFGEAGKNEVTLSGHRVQVSIVKAIGPASGEAMIRVYGVPLERINEITSLNSAAEVARDNRVIVKAGDDLNGMATVFIGQIVLSQFDLSDQPEAAINIMAHGNGLDPVRKVPPLTYTGPTDAAIVMQDIAARMRKTFENNGVSVVLSRPYFKGSPWEMAQECVKAAGIQWNGGEDDIVAIWPKGGRRGGAVPPINKDSGLIGYPHYASTSTTGQLSVKTVFNPLLRLGNVVKVESGLKVANGLWQAYYIAHEIESEVPGGQWFTRFDGAAYG